MMKGIDVSKWNGNVDFEAVKAAGFKFVIIRAGCGMAKDPMYARNYEAAHKAGLHTGAYWYAQWVKSPEDEAKAFLAAVDGDVHNMGIWYDVEWEKNILAANKTARTTGTLRALEALSKSGRYVGLYCSTAFLLGYLEAGRLAAYDVWIADYRFRVTPETLIPYGMRQTSGSATIAGVYGMVDTNEAYKDYPGITGGTVLATGTLAPPSFEEKVEAYLGTEVYEMCLRMEVLGWTWDFDTVDNDCGGEHVESITFVRAVAYDEEHPKPDLT